MLRGSLAALVCLAAGAAVAQPAARPTDPQIAKIVVTADQIDIDAAQLALKKSKNKDVRAFAKDMIRDHKAVNAKATALAKKLKIKPEDSDTSRSLKQQADQTRKQLSGLKGADFDKAYVQNEVAYHQQVIGAVQNTLIPSASNDELKNLLSTGLPIFQGHLQHAQQLSQSL